MNPNFLERLQAIVATGKSKQFTKMLNKQPRLKGSYSKRTDGNLDLLEWVRSQAAVYNPVNLNHAIHIIINGEPPRCPQGFYRSFNTYEKGYHIGCVEKTCDCNRQSQAEKLKSYHKNLTAEQKAANLAAARETSMANWGVPNPMQSPEQLEKIRQRNLEKIGYEWHTQVPDTREKMKQTCMERHGTESPLASPKILAKTQATTIERYGKLMTHARVALGNKYNGLNPFQVPEIKEQIKKSMLERYGVEHALQHPEFLKKAQDTLLENWGVYNGGQRHYNKQQRDVLLNQEKFTEFVTGKTSVQVGHELGGVRSDTIIGIARRYNVLDLMIFKSKSAMEDDMCQWLDQLGVSYIRNNKSVIPNGLQLDFYFPEHNLAVELNGLFHHAEISMGRSKLYHYIKWKDCAQLGIQLVTIWQDEYWRSREVIRSKILYKLRHNSFKKIGARNCDILHLTTEQEYDFYVKNHIQGFASYRQHTLAAEHQNQIIACMSWSKRSDNWEIIRYATDINCVVPGMFSKLLKHSIDGFGISGKVVSFSDNRVSNGQLYHSNGFIADKLLKPSYCYTKDYNLRESRENFYKSKLKKRFNLDPSVLEEYTEWEIAQILGYDRLWDCGKIRWVKTI